MDDNEKLKQLEDMLDRMKEAFRDTETAAEKLAEQLLKDNKLSQERYDQIKKEVTENKKLLDQKKYEETRAIQMAKSYDMAKSAVTAFASSMIPATTAIYTATDAFTSVSPALNMAGTLIKRLAEAAGEATGGIPFIGGLGKAAAKTVGIGLDITMQVVNANLQMSQKLANDFAKVGEAGVTFGGNLDSMTAAAARSGQTVDKFTGFISKNLQPLAGLGGNVSENAVQLLKMSRNIGDTNRGLLVSYGSYEALNDGIARYVGLQQQLGFVDVRNQKEMTEGATSYLIRQRELTSITGKRADQLMEEEKRRRGELDYALKLSGLSKAQQANVEATMQIAGRIGPEAEAYIKEYFATGGRVVSKQAVTFESMQGAVAKTLTETLAGATTMDAAAFKENTGRVLQANAPALEAFAKSVEELASINRAAMNPVIDSMAKTSAGILQNMTFFKNATDLFAELDKAAKNLEDAGPNLGKSTQVTADAIQGLLKNQQALDIVAKDSMVRMKEFLDVGFMLNDMMIQKTGAVADVVAELAKGTNTSVKELERLVRVVLGMTDPASTTYPEPRGGGSTSRADPGNRSNTPTRPGPPLPEATGRASGGLVNKPVIAGEDGPEAIIPLAKGAVPLDIDWTPMIRAINELLAATEEGNDVRERLLKSSY